LDRRPGTARRTQVSFLAAALIHFFDGYEKMKLQKLEWGKAARKLIPLIAAGRLRSEATEPFIHGTYLEAWFRCLKCSKEFTHSCRTGMFMSEGAAETYRLFGPLEDLSYSDWWMSKGHSFFSESITTLQVTLYMQRKDTGVFSVSVDAAQDISSQLAGREFGFWLDQISLLNARGGLLSGAPLSWPIFRSRISYEAISQLLSIMEIHDQIIRNAPETKLWQIGEQIRLNPRAMPKLGDFPIDIADKHKAMGQAVSSYLRKGRALAVNACRGAFPKFEA